MIHQWNIDESSMKQLRITDEEIAMFTCSTAEFIKLRNLQISFFPIKLSKTIELKSKWAIIRTLSEKKLTGVFKNDFYAYRGTLWAICFGKNYHVFRGSSWSIFFAKGTKISTLKTIMIINVCIEIINVSSMLHLCPIVVSVMNRPVFLWQH